MNDFADLALLKYFEEQAKGKEKTGDASSVEGQMETTSPLLSLDDALAQSWEVAMFEQMLEEKADA